MTIRIHRKRGRGGLKIGLLGLLVAALSGCPMQGGRSTSQDTSPPEQPTGPTLSPSPADTAETRCADFRPGYLNAYFGDLHTHTSYSLDAYFFNALTDPRMAHRYAKGREPLPIPAKGSQDVFSAGGEIWLERPLDFNAVTDHAEFLGGFTTTCSNSDLAEQACDRAVGQGVRDNVRDIAAGNIPFQTQLLQSLVADFPTTISTWNETRRINDEEYEPCHYTTFNAYEYTSNSLSQMFHRNVIFRGDANQVPLDVFPAVLPTTASFPENGNDDWRLFDHLNQNCTSTNDCEALTIIHNSNRSDGRMFLAAGESAGLTVLGDLGGVPLGRKLQGTDIYLPMSTADATLRRKFDRSFEMTQHKGQSECSPDGGSYLTNDEGYDPGCVFEVDMNLCRGLPGDPPACARLCTGDPWVDPPFCGFRDHGQNTAPVCAITGPDGMSRPAKGGETTSNCRSPLDYYRYAMVEGEKIRQTLGINPYKVNIVAALDTHAANSGSSSEAEFTGHSGVLDDDPHEQLGYWGCDDEAGGEDPADPANCSNRTFVDFARVMNPGGVAGVWAKENTRGPIFDAIRDGQSWGTSGPRIRVRSVASWSPLPENICERLASGEDLPASEDLHGVAMMGADLDPALVTDAGPYIAVWAEQDPDGYPLQQIDLVKGYLDADGEPRVTVFNKAVGTADVVRRPDPTSCAVPVQNHPESLCLRWQDANFDPARDAYWYPRVREVPSCRWSAWICRAEKNVDCGLLDSSNGQFPADSAFAGYEGCCQISESDGVFSGSERFDTIEERAWGSPVWYEPPVTAVR